MWRTKIPGLLVLCAGVAASGCERSDSPQRRVEQGQGQTDTPPDRRPADERDPRHAADSPAERAASPVERHAPASDLRYFELVTGGANSNARLPLVVAIHGLGDRPEAFLRLFAGFAMQARILAPQGLDPHGSGFAWFPLSMGKPERLAQTMGRPTEVLAKALDELTSLHPTTGRPVVTGFSQGGMLTFALAAKAPEKIAAALPVAGLLPSALFPKVRPSRSLPVIAFHGDADRIVPFAPAKQTVAQFRELGYEATLHPFRGVGHFIPEAMRKQLFHELARLVRGAEAEGSP